MFQSQEPSSQSPFEIIAYADEITPGNALKHDNQRKVQCIYWAWKQHGVQRLSNERFWFVLGMARSDTVKRLPGKMSEFFKLAMLKFFTPIDIRQGILLHFPGSERKVLFGDLGIILADEVAIKEVLDCKGAAGSLPCPLCRNVVDHKSDLASHDHSGTMVPTTNLDLSLFEFHSDASIRDIMRFLKENQHGTKSAFKRMQQFTGFNYNEHGALMSQELALKPVSTLMFDWMHTFVSGGIWNAEVGLLLGKLRAVGFTQRDLHDELQKFTWPFASASRSATGKKVFSKDQEGDVSCSASEALSLYSVLRFILLEKVRAGELAGVQPCISSYLNLSRVLDLIQNIKRQSTQASVLENAILTHLRSYILAYGHQRFLPKHHFACHLGRQLSQHKMLCACFTMERKHKEIKRYASGTTNTVRGWEKNVLTDVINMQIQELNECEGDPWKPGLRNPTIPSEAMTAALQAALGSESNVVVSRTANYAPGAASSIGDACLLSLEGKQHLGQVRFFAQIEKGQPVACIQKWTSLGHNQFKVSNEDPILCELPCIQDTCVYTSRETCLAVAPNSCWAA